MNLFERFATLKKQVGGNWEKEKFEHTMGMEVRCVTELRQVLVEMLLPVTVEEGAVEDCIPAST